MGTVIQVEILHKAVCISHSGNTFYKGMYPDILPVAMDK